MHRAILILILASAPFAAQAQDVKLPAGLHGARVDQAMATLASEAAVVYRDEDKQRYLGTLFRLQVASGRDAQAVASIETLRTLRNDPPSQPPLYLQYEIHSRARVLQAQRGIDYVQAWRTVFAERFGALPDAVALQAEYGFGGALPRMREDFAKALAGTNGKRTLPLAEAIALVRAWQVQAAYAAFLPLFNPALEEDDARRYAIDRDVLVASADGARIATLLVHPRGEQPQTALLQFTIYANDDWAWADAKKMASRGYAGVVAYSRGKGRSPDTIEPYVRDGVDAAAVIDWIAAQPWSDGRVGMYGGSYSGFTQWAALRHHPNALKAIATSATLAPGIDVPMEGGVFLNFMYRWPFYAASNRGLDDARYSDAARWAALDRAWYASGRAYRDLPAVDGSANPVFLEWLRHPTYDAWWQAMIPQGDAFAAIDIPVLVTTGYFDGAQVGALHYFREHLRNRPNADHTLVIGPFEHFSMQTGVPPVVQGYAVDPSARIDLQALRLDWFDHVFKGTAKPALLADRVNWQVMGADTWRHAPSLDAMATRTRRLCLQPGAAGQPGRLSATPHTDAVTHQRIDFADRGDAGWTPSDRVVNSRLDAHAGLVFISAPFAQDMELAGPFAGSLHFTVNKRDVDLAIGIYELNSKGEYLDLAWWLQRASLGEDRRRRHLLQPGVLQHLAVRDTRLLGRKLAAGSRVVVTLGVAKQPDRQLNYGTGVDPSDETIGDAGMPLEIAWRGSSCLDFGVRE